MIYFLAFLKFLTEITQFFKKRDFKTTQVEIPIVFSGWALHWLDCIVLRFYFMIKLIF